MHFVVVTIVKMESLGLIDLIRCGHHLELPVPLLPPDQEVGGGGGAGHEPRAEDDVEGVVAAPLAVSHPGEHRLGPDHLPDVVTHRVETEPRSCNTDVVIIRAPLRIEDLVIAGRK